jgi:hypothetical protein
MPDPTREILLAVLDVLREQAEYLHRQHGWMIAVAETLRDADLGEQLERHPFYNQGPRPDFQKTGELLRTIDELRVRLRALIELGSS